MNTSENDNYINKYNNSPLEKLSGLTPTQTHELIYNPLGEGSCIQFSKDINSETLDKIHFFRTAEELLKIIKRDGFKKLTPLGALPKKVLVELYSHKLILDEFIELGISKLHHEDYCISIKTARIVCELTNLVKKSKGKLLLTKNGEKHLQIENRVELFKVIFTTFAHKFNWSYHDGYTDEPVSQYGYLFSIFLLKKYGDNANPTHFYAMKYLAVFAKFITLFNSDYSTVEKHFSSCYSLRTFARFTEWFGFTSVTEKRNYLEIESEKIIKTSVLENVFVYN